MRQTLTWLGIFSAIALAVPAAAQQKPQAPAVPVVVATVTAQDVPVWLRGIGQVKPQQSVEIRPQVDGLLQQVLVREGEMVSAGQLLATLDDRAIKAALAQAKAQRAVVEAKLNVAKRDLQRYQNLSQSQAISAQQKDQQQANVQQLQAELQSVDAQINAQQVQLSFTQIHAPISGQVGIRNVDAGNYVRPSDTQGLFSVVQLDPISVEMALPQAQLPQLQQLMQQVRQQQAVPVEAFVQDGGEKLASGTLAVVDNKVSTGSGTIRIKADFTNPTQALWPAQTVVVALRSKLLAQALTIPVKALQQGPQGAFVWTVDGDKAKVVPVQVQESTETVVVVSGVSAGQQVVVDGQSRLRPGATVLIKTAAEQAQAAKAKKQAKQAAAEHAA
ncbi:efflux RND transporter periplasmic adaptor subunit [Rheinheimera texasensis]|uniref:efflux RND transporter periplasmic adaptor subunit n=1 Tax=Rheinheimera texasensis TaxID=306205 RepID=UPI000A012006|nr:efflux RND transporter periplasmic adaptor subunit [Rheinheimera texasensis]